MNNLIGKTVTVYDRYLFAVPVKGHITSVSGKDGAFQVIFLTDNPGGKNVTKHDGKFFHREQCRVEGNKLEKFLKTLTDFDLIKELYQRKTHYHGVSPKPIVTPYNIMCKMIEQGWQENPKQGESNPQIDRIWDYLGYPTFTDDQSYCAATVNVCLKLAGYKTSESIPVARSFENYGKSVTSNNNSASPVKQGDIVVFRNCQTAWKGHVGFIDEFKEHKIIVAGGNQDNMMCFKNYKDNIFLIVSAYRRITDNEKIGEPDYKTLKEWGLI